MINFNTFLKNRLLKKKVLINTQLNIYGKSIEKLIRYLNEKIELIIQMKKKQFLVMSQ